MADQPVARPAKYHLLKALSEASGYPTLQRGIGAARAVTKYGLPDKVTLEGGRVIWKDQDASDAENFGDLTIAPSNADKSTIKHEATGRISHAAQADVLGPALLPARLIEAFYPYGKGPLEKAAFHSMGSDKPLPPDVNGDLYQRLMNMYFRKTTGEE